MLRKITLPLVVAMSITACATLPAPPPSGSQQPTAAPARAKVTHIRFSLDWAIEGPSAPFPIALDKGYFAEEGLSVVIDRGTGSAGTVTKIASGAYEMGYADINSMIEFNVKNPDKALQAIAILYNNAPMTVFTLKGKGINLSLPQTRPALNVVGKPLWKWRHSVMAASRYAPARLKSVKGW
jgi:NitT/TauT family transport system substrate-binding protein